MSVHIYIIINMEVSKSIPIQCGGGGGGLMIGKSVYGVV